VINHDQSVVIDNHHQRGTCGAGAAGERTASTLIAQIRELVGGYTVAGPLLVTGRTHRGRPAGGASNGKKRAYRAFQTRAAEGSGSKRAEGLELIADQ